jgi:hypothetical protein
MGIGPVPATRTLLERTGLSVADIDVFEVNEAFAAQALAVARDLGLPADKVNPNGSGISLGHPIGATGCIITVKALHELARSGGRRALVTMCIGGGQGIAACSSGWIERRPRDVGVEQAGPSNLQTQVPDGAGHDEPVGRRRQGLRAVDGRPGRASRLRDEALVSLTGDYLGIGGELLRQAAGVDP